MFLESLRRGTITYTGLTQHSRNRLGTPYCRLNLQQSSCSNCPSNPPPPLPPKKFFFKNYQLVHILTFVSCSSRQHQLVIHVVQLHRIGRPDSWGEKKYKLLDSTQRASTSAEGGGVGGGGGGGGGLKGIFRKFCRFCIQIYNLNLFHKMQSLLPVVSSYPLLKKIFRTKKNILSRQNGIK